MATATPSAESPEPDERLQRDLETEMVIDRAQGVMMERRRLTAHAALDLLRARSRATGLPLPDTARWLICTGTLP
jgi:AmiR/NasT family two-component response regulator